MAAGTRKAPTSTRKFGLLRFIAYLHVFVGILILVGGVIGAIIALTFNPVMMGPRGQAFSADGGLMLLTSISVFVGALVVALVYFGIGHAILAFLSIEEHTRRSALAQEQLLRVNMQLLRQLDQRLP